MILAFALSAALTAAPVCIASVHDGDTLTLCGGTRVRLAGIDAPELPGSDRCRRLRTGPNPSWCDHALAYRSRDALRALLASGPVRIERRGVDRYGRVLARVTVNGRDVGQWLVRRGLAREWRR